MASYVIVHALGVAMLCVCASSISVHFSTPGGHGNEWAGLYRVEVNVDTLLNNQSAYTGQDLTEAEIQCANVQGTFHQGLSTRSLSYDPPAKRTYFQPLLNFNEEVSTMLYKGTCEPQTGCYNKDGALVKLMSNLATTDEGHISPIASRDGTVYFIYTPDTRNEVYFGYRPYLQLRQIKADYYFSSDKRSPPVNVDSFSRLLANISVEGEAGRWLHSAYQLLAIPSSNGQLLFLTVVRGALYPDPPKNQTMQEFSHYLVAVAVDPEGSTPAEAKIIHSTKSQRVWYGHSIGEEGGLSYKDGTVCWSVVDTLLCGDWAPENGLESPTNIINVIRPGQANHVCNGTYHGSDLYINVTTGVAVVETMATNGRLALFFGCFATLSGRGGLGMLVREPGKDVQILRVADEAGPLFAGSMFVTEDDLCPPTTTSQPTTTEGSSGLGPASSVGRVGGHQLVTSLSALLLVVSNLLH